MNVRIHSLILFVSMGTALPLHAASIFQENFPHPGSGNISHNNTAIGWNAYYGSGATNDSSNTQNGAGGGFVVSPISGGYGAKAVASGSNTAYGVAYTTEVASLSIPVADITSISFLAKNASASDRMRVVIGIDVGGSIQWFASETAFGTTAGAWDAGAESKSLPFSLSASSWRSLTFVAGSSLSLADAALVSSLPTGNLAAAGLFLSGSSAVAGVSGGSHAGTMRYDDFTVSYVPEPSSAALGALAGAFLMSRRRKA